VVKKALKGLGESKIKCYKRETSKFRRGMRPRETTTERKGLVPKEPIVILKNFENIAMTTPWILRYKRF